MGIISSTKRKIGHFILDHFLTEEVVSSWKAGHVEGPLPPTLYATGPVPSIERNTDRIDVKAVEAAIKAQNIKAVRGRALDVPQEYLAPGKLIRWYRDQENHVNKVSNENTVSLNAIKLQ